MAPMATARLVPSPPSVIRQPTPISAIMAAARVVSPSVYSGDMGSISSGMLMLESAAARRQRFPLSGMATTRSTSVDCSPINARRIVFTFSQSGTTRPCATSRRMSLLAAGLAMIPTVAIFETPLSLAERGQG